MEPNSQQSHGLGFVLGLMAGTVVGAGLTLWLAPGSRLSFAIARPTLRGRWASGLGRL